jgi:hypothetical protein
MMFNGAPAPGTLPAQVSFGTMNIIGVAAGLQALKRENCCGKRWKERFSKLCFLAY